MSTIGEICLMFVGGSLFQERDCDICGVEITDNALPVNQHPFKRSTAFLLGNEVGDLVVLILCWNPNSYVSW